MIKPAAVVCCYHKFSAYFLLPLFSCEDQNCLLKFTLKLMLAIFACVLLIFTNISTTRSNRFVDPSYKMFKESADYRKWEAKEAAKKVNLNFNRYLLLINMTVCNYFKDLYTRYDEHVKLLNIIHIEILVTIFNT